MILFPAIDLLGGRAVRLYKGDYDNVTVYSERPWEVAKGFAALGADHVHIVDLDGARDGGTPNLETVLKIKKESGVFCEVGGGVRSMETVEKYLSSGVDRVILGTAAVEDEAFLVAAVKKYGDKIAVGADLKDGYVAVKGWRVVSDVTADGFFSKMESLGVKTVICTDISKDGAMSGTNLSLYREITGKYGVNVVASGGVSSLSDLESLKKMDLYGAIIGKAYYTGDVDLAEALEVCRDN